MIRSFIMPRDVRGTVLDAARAADLPIVSECNGQGHCGKCRVRYPMQAPAPTAADHHLVSAHDLHRGFRLACQHAASPEVRLEVDDAGTDALIQIDAYGGRPIDASPTTPGRFGVAADIGTTTVAVALVDLGSHEVVTTASGLNPQARYGADVLTRISHATTNGVHGLQQLIVSALADLVRDVARQAGVELGLIDKVTVCGNTTMLYLLRGLDPAPLAVYPFIAEHVGAASVDGAALLRIAELGNCTAVFLPGVSAYVGADIVSGLYYLGVDQLTDLPRMLVDIGTNGEIALIEAGRITCTATAAGPAFEGASVSCGVGSIQGAVNKVWWDADGVHYTTIADEPAVGVCGSAIVDLLVYGLEIGWIQPSGRMPEPLALPDTPAPIILEQRDVRSLQLAKAAIRSGMQIMLSHAGLTPTDVRGFYIAGGFGRYLDREHAARIGLLPSTVLNRVEPIGNSALGGAIYALYDPEFTQRQQSIVARCTAVDLSSQADFSATFISNITFPRTESQEASA